MVLRHGSFQKEISFMPYMVLQAVKWVVQGLKVR